MFILILFKYFFDFCLKYLQIFYFLIVSKRLNLIKNRYIINLNKLIKNFKYMLNFNYIIKQLPPPPPLELPPPPPPPPPPENPPAPLEPPPLLPP